MKFVLTLVTLLFSFNSLAEFDPFPDLNKAEIPGTLACDIPGSELKVLIILEGNLSIPYGVQVYDPARNVVMEAEKIILIENNDLEKILHLGNGGKGYVRGTWKEKKIVVTLTLDRTSIFNEGYAYLEQCYEIVVPPKAAPPVSSSTASN